MKQELLEYLVRSCVKEVIAQVKEAEDETKATAPPADVTGAGDNLGIPKEKDTTSQSPSKPETPSSALLEPEGHPKGICFVNPRNKSELIKLFQEPTPTEPPMPTGKPGRKPKSATPAAPAAMPTTPTGNPVPPQVSEVRFPTISPMVAYSHIPPKQLTSDKIERVIYYLASKYAGSKVKIANSTLRDVDKAIKSGGTLFLYIGKFDETSDEIYVLAEANLEAAKIQSLPPSELGGTTALPGLAGADDFDPNTASGEDVARYMDKDAPGKVRSYGVPDEPDDRGDVDEQKLHEVKTMIKKLVNEVLNK